MSLRVHDDVARQYNSDDGIIAAKNQAVLEGLKQRFGPRAAALRVADLGVGDGAQLQMLTTLACPLAMTGLDVSPAMLRLAAQRVPLTAVLAPAQDAAAHLPHGAFDLVLAMDDGHYRQLLRLCPPQYRDRVKLYLSYAPQFGRDVPDPYYGKGDGFEKVWQMCQAVTDALVTEIRSRLR